MNKPKVIVADIDGTLVPRHQELSLDTINTIKNIRRNGIYFGIASGRPKNELASLLTKWKKLGIENDLVIASNGCVLIDNINNLEHEYYFLQPKQIKEAFRFMKPFKYNPTCAIDGKSCCGYYDEFVKISEKYIGTKVILCESKDYHEMWQQPVGKIMFRVDAEDMPKIEDYYQKNKPHNIIGFKTNPMAFEFTDPRASKGVALENFCKAHNIDIKDSMAFGDTTNDNQMLLKAGIGVCLKNGSDDTKKCANYITDYDVDNDGFAQFIHKNLCL